MDLNAEDYQIYRVADRNKKTTRQKTTTTKIGENKPKTETHRQNGNPKQKNTTRKQKHKSQNGNKHSQQETHAKTYKIKPQN